MITVNFTIDVTSIDMLVESEQYDVSIDFAPIVVVSGGGTTIVATAAVGGHRAISVNGDYVQPSTLDLLFGISENAASIGSLISVVTKGKMTEGSWNWTPNQPIFITNDGVLTQTMPSSTPIRRVAWAVSPTVINVDFFPIISQ